MRTGLHSIIFLPDITLGKRDFNIAQSIAVFFVKVNSNLPVHFLYA